MGSVLFRSLTNSKLPVTEGFRASEDRLSEVRAEGEVEEEEVGEFGEGGERPLEMGKGRLDELTFCSLSNRCCLKVDESRRASAEKLDAERLARSALAWLEEAVKEDSAPSWGYFRNLEGRWPEKLAALVLARSDSVALALLMFRLRA